MYSKCYKVLLALHFVTYNHVQFLQPLQKHSYQNNSVMYPPGGKEYLEMFPFQPIFLEDLYHANKQK